MTPGATPAPGRVAREPFSANDLQGLAPPRVRDAHTSCTPGWPAIACDFRGSLELEAVTRSAALRSAPAVEGFEAFRHRAERRRSAHRHSGREGKDGS